MCIKFEDFVLVDSGVLFSKIEIPSIIHIHRDILIEGGEDCKYHLRDFAYLFIR